MKLQDGDRLHFGERYVECRATPGAFVWLVLGGLGGRWTAPVTSGLFAHIPASTRMYTWTRRAHRRVHELPDGLGRHDLHGGRPPDPGLRPHRLSACVDLGIVCARAWMDVWGLGFDPTDDHPPPKKKHSTRVTEGSPDRMFDSIHTKVFSLPAETLVYPGACLASVLWEYPLSLSLSCVARRVWLFGIQWGSGLTFFLTQPSRPRLPRAHVHDDRGGEEVQRAPRRQDARGVCGNHEQPEARCVFVRFLGVKLVKLMDWLEGPFVPHTDPRPFFFETPHFNTQLQTTPRRSTCRCPPTRWTASSTAEVFFLPGGGAIACESDEIARECMGVDGGGCQVRRLCPLSDRTAIYGSTRDMTSLGFSLPAGNDGRKVYRARKKRTKGGFN